jgi:cell division septum initiation protein DivIVA
LQVTTAPRTDAALPELTPEVTPEELLTSIIPIIKRGYEPDVIDGLLERAAATIERLRALDTPALESQRRERADLLHRTLLMAQTSADRTVAEAQASAAAMLEEAERRVTRLIADAHQIAAHLVESEHARAQLTVGEAVTRRQVLQSDIDALERFATRARARLRGALECESGTLERLLGEATEDRPVLHEIDLTDPMLQMPVLGEGRVAWSDAGEPVEALHR